MRPGPPKKKKRTIMLGRAKQHYTTVLNYWVGR
jgi:hypothetical protein